MIIRSVSHRGLRRFIEEGNPRFLQQDLTDRVLKTVTALLLANNISSFIQDAPTGWRVHQLSGNRQNEWSISVSSNWRITFEMDGDHVNHLNLEDYH